MAVLIEGISVVLRVETVRSRYPGGWERFRMDCPNETLCADGELIRVGFMTPADTQQFVEGLGRFGIEFLRDGRAVDIVVADQQRGFTATCDWADFGQMRLNGDANKPVSVCQSKGNKSHELATPRGWDYQNSLSADFTFVETGRVSEFMDFLRHEDGMDVYRDLHTGAAAYVGRTRPDRPGAKVGSKIYPLRLPEDTSPVKLEACRAYARMMNTLDFSHLEPWLAEELIYTSQWVTAELRGKGDYGNYIRGKFDAIRKAGTRVWAEIAYTDAFGAGPCVVLAQGSKDNLQSTLLITMQGEQILQMTMCGMPSPHECRRTGEQPT